MRDAVADYAARTDRLTERERLRAMGVLEGLRDARSSRPVSEVEVELRSLRAARRGGGRRHRSA